MGLTSGACRVNRPIEFIGLVGTYRIMGWVYRFRARIEVSVRGMKTPPS